MGEYRKIELARVEVGDESVTRKVDLGTVGPAHMHGAIRIDGAAPPRERLCVVAEKQIDSKIVFPRLHLEGPIARVGPEGRFALRTEPGDYTLLVLDTSTRVILHRVDGVEVSRGDRPVDVGELRFRVTRLDLRLAGPGARDVAGVEIRPGKLWPAGIGAILGSTRVSSSLPRSAGRFGTGSRRWPDPWFIVNEAGGTRGERSMWTEQTPRGAGGSARRAAKKYTAPLNPTSPVGFDDVGPAAR